MNKFRVLIMPGMAFLLTGRRAFSLQALFLAVMIVWTLVSSPRRTIVLHSFTKYPFYFYDDINIINHQVAYNYSFTSVNYYQILFFAHYLQYARIS